MKHQSLFQVILRDIRIHALTIFAFALVIGASFFYHHVEKWSMLDALYFSVVTISTVGYGDVTPHTEVGKIFTIFYVLIGLGLFAMFTASIGDNLIKVVKQKD